jgi:hypothetical protein
LGFFLAAYLVTTPGTLLQPDRFLEGLRYQQTAYTAERASYLGHGPHLWRMTMYLSTIFFSHYKPIAIFFTLLAVIGIASTWSANQRFAICLLSFPVFYVALFSFYHLMVVRNLIVLFPFLAVFAALGAKSLLDRIDRPPYRWILGTLLAACLVLNAAWSAAAAFSIRNRSIRVYLGQLMTYLERNPNIRFGVSHAVADQLTHFGYALPTNAVVGHRTDSDRCVFFAKEAGWGANRFDWHMVWFGPGDVNIMCYGAWVANDRLIVIPTPETKNLVQIRGFAKK